MAFKMKGNPMHRNFGIGSPAKQAKPDVEGEEKVMDKRKKAIEDHRKNAPKTTNTQEQADQLNTIDQRNVDAFNTSNDSIQNVHNTWNKHVEEQNAIIDSTNTANDAAYDEYMESIKKKNTPNKQFEEGDYYDTRSKSPAKQTISSVSDSLQSLPNPAAEKLRKEYEAAIKKLQEDAQEKLDANSDSTNQSNSDVLNKRAKQIAKNVSGREYEKQVDEYNEKNSPNKQTHYGGTQSGKGNIFTKKGRTQRKVNRYKKSSERLLDNANKEGFDTKKSKKLMKKTKKRLSKTSQLHQDVQSGKTVIYTGGDPKDNSNYINNGTRN